MKKITIFDTFVCSGNMGDAIIMDYALKQNRRIFPDAWFYHVPTHEYIRRRTYKNLLNTEEKIVCGSNLLHNKMYIYNHWKINLIDCVLLRDVCFMGVGASHYYDKLGTYAVFLLKKVLSRKLLHSVRDGYTEEIMRRAGFDNVINTACVSMWDLTPSFCKSIPHHKAENVVTTLTDYAADPEVDKRIMEILRDNYQTVYLWIQGFRDYSYAEKLGILQDVEIVSPSLDEYDKILSREDVEYVGTRLHAGTRALNFKKRTTVIGVDNRAKEMGESFALNTIDRRDAVNILEEHVNQEIVMQLRIPEDNISRWKAQFVQ